MKKKALVILAAFLAVLVVLLTACADGSNQPVGPKTISGYLICQNCGLMGKCEATGTNLTTHPEKYTLKCAKMPDCITSGYGVAVKQDNGKYMYYTFDYNGSVLALNNIIYATKKADNLLVEVKGTMDEKIGNRIKVETIKEE